MLSSSFPFSIWMKLTVLCLIVCMMLYSYAAEHWAQSHHSSWPRSWARRRHGIQNGHARFYRLQYWVTWSRLGHWSVPHGRQECSPYHEGMYVGKGSIVKEALTGNGRHWEMLHNNMHVCTCTHTHTHTHTHLLGCDWAGWLGTWWSQLWLQGPSWVHCPWWHVHLTHR